MNPEPNFKQIWNLQKDYQMPDAVELKKAAIQFKQKELSNMIIMNTIMFLTIVYLIIMGFRFSNGSIIMMLGIGIICISIITFLLFYNSLYYNLKKIEMGYSNNVFLNNLLLLKKKQTIIQTRVMVFYFISLSTGLFLALFEPLSTMPSSWRIISSCITAGWILFVWFYLRPRIIQKQNQKLNPFIQRFEAISHQLTDNDK